MLYLVFSDLSQQRCYVPVGYVWTEPDGWLHIQFHGPGDENHLLRHDGRLYDTPFGKFAYIGIHHTRPTDLLQIPVESMKRFCDEL